jgi:hypothetical protein
MFLLEIDSICPLYFNYVITIVQNRNTIVIHNFYALIHINISSDLLILLVNFNHLDFVHNLYYDSL